MKNDKTEIRPINANALTQHIAAITVLKNYDAHKACSLIKIIDTFPSIVLSHQEGTITDYAKSLSSCKFCGGKAALFLAPDTAFADDISVRNGHYIACMICGCRTPTYHDMDKAIHAWNRTPNET